MMGGQIMDLEWIRVWKDGKTEGKKEGRESDLAAEYAPDYDEEEVVRAVMKDRAKELKAAQG